MPRTTWTDERLDDFSRRIDAGFGRIDADVRELRMEVRQTGAEVRGEVGALRITLIRVGGAVMAGLAAVIAAVLTSG